MRQPCASSACPAMNTAFWLPRTIARQRNFALTRPRLLYPHGADSGPRRHSCACVFTDLSRSMDRHDPSCSSRSSGVLCSHSSFLLGRFSAAAGGGSFGGIFPPRSGLESSRMIRATISAFARPLSLRPSARHRSLRRSRLSAWRISSIRAFRGRARASMSCSLTRRSSTSSSWSSRAVRSSAALRLGEDGAFRGHRIEIRCGQTSMRGQADP